MANRAIAFMEKNKQANKPFFIQMSWHALHAPQNALKTTLAKYSQRLGSSADEKRVGSAAIAENLDTGVGMVVDAVDRLGLAWLATRSSSRCPTTVAAVGKAARVALQEDNAPVLLAEKVAFGKAAFAAR